MSGIRWSKVKETDHDKIIIICSGPSLKDFDFDKIKGLGYIITVNDSAKYVPFADAWFTLDPWGLQGPQLPNSLPKDKLYAAVPEDYGLYDAKCSNHRSVPSNKINLLHRIQFHTVSNLIANDYLTWGLNEDKSCINTGNSGYGALNLAYHMRPKKIMFLGLDSSSGYFYNTQKMTRSLSHLPMIFKSSVPQLKEAKIEIINASPDSKITCFPKYTIDAGINRFQR